MHTLRGEDAGCADARLKICGSSQAALSGAHFRRPTLPTWNSQPSAQPPNPYLPSKKNLNHFFLVSHSRRDNVNNDYVKRSRNSLYRTIKLHKLF